MINLFSGYLWFLSQFAGGDHSRSLTHPAPFRHDELEDFGVADRLAVLLSNRYRSVGILLTLFGVLIVTCAVAPVALDLDHQTGFFWGLAEIALMISVIIIWFRVNHSQLRDRWLAARKTAEQLHYQDLSNFIGRLTQCRSDTAQARQATVTLHASLVPLLSSQITYHQAKSAQYHGIERGGERIAITVFVVALLAALIHLRVHTTALLFLAAVGPMVAAAVHRTNSFLRLNDLAEHHRDTARALDAMRLTLISLDAQTVTPQDLLELARAAHRHLSDQEERWLTKATAIDPKLGSSMYHKIQVPVGVVFASSEGVLQTLEGTVSYCQGDPLLRGVAGECWPIKRTVFDATYEAIAPTLSGNDGRYRKRYQCVMAEKLTAPTSVRVTEADCLHSQAGDWLLTDQHGRQWIVADAVFVRTYVKDDLP